MCLMKAGIKHSLCLISIVSKAQPSESMPMRKSHFLVKRSSGLSVIGAILRENPTNHRGTETQRRKDREDRREEPTKTAVLPVLRLSLFFSSLCLCASVVS